MITFVSDSAGTGGAEFLAVSLARALARRGHDVRFLVPPGRLGEDWVRSLPPGAARGAPLRNKATYPLRSLQAAADLPRIAALRRELRNAGTVIVNQADPEDGVATTFAASAAGARVVGLLHLTADLPRLGATRLVAPRRALARAAFRLHERVISVSHASAEEVRRLWCPRARGVPNGIDLPEPEASGEREEARRALGLPPDAPVVAALGRLAPQKGLDDLLDALPSVRAAVPGVHVALAGDGELRAELERRAAGLPVRFLGWRRARPVLLAADVLALPSRFEGLPLTILEAGALGRDVVAYAVDGIPEVLDPSALVRPGDVPALAAALIQSLTRGEKRASRAAALQARVRAQHSSDAMAARFEEALA